MPGKVKIDWSSLGFNYIPTKSHIRYTWSGGRWDGGRLLKKHEICMSVAATCLHYGQACFEGLKAFRWADGGVRIFRPAENARRMNATADYILCPQVPEEMFIDAVRRVIRDNMDYVPPYGTKGALYIRPLLIGTGPRIGVAPADTYDFLVMVTPVGNYYREGITPVRTVIFDDFDRTAPSGTGHIKMAGNYAAGLKAQSIAKKMDIPVVLYLDSKTKTFIDEFGTSNFIGISAEGHYVTPDSRTILPSITNKSLMQLAGDAGIKVERRPIRFDELPSLKEIAACGTAVVITPIKEIVYGKNILRFSDKCGPVLRKLYDELTGIQFGERPDVHGWLLPLEE